MPFAFAYRKSEIAAVQVEGNQNSICIYQTPKSVRE